MDSVIEFSERIREAAARSGRCAFAAAAPRTFYGGALDGDVLDTAVLCGHRELRADRAGVTARAGTPLAEVEAALAERGQMLAFEPPHFGGRHARRLRRRGLLRDRAGRPRARCATSCSECAS